ncbi:MAG: hypothetical protein SH809_00740 [Rhodothermales bacterium]|nr:hypothetical protein [Rhodothermales bacterium]
MTLLVATGAGGVYAQQPFQAYDPFYRSEQTQREFFGGYALSGEVSYRAAGVIQDDGLQSLEANPLGLSFRLDYQLAPQLDMSGIIDAAGNSTRGGLALSWVVFTYYERNEETTFALRLAVDPSFDGPVGFPQMDLGWLSSSSITPTTTSNFAFGVRRIRLGYEQWVLGDEPTPGVGSGSYVLHSLGADDPNRNVDIIYTRAFGWEARLMLGYDFAFDPAGSNVFFSLLGQAGNYDLVETSFLELSPKASQKSIGEQEVTIDSDYIGGAVWLRSGLEFNRPGYQILPFIGLPIVQWAPESANWPRSRRRVGVRLMLR